MVPSLIAGGKRKTSKLATIENDDEDIEEKPKRIISDTEKETVLKLHKQAICEAEIKRNLDSIKKSWVTWG